MMNPYPTVFERTAEDLGSQLREAAIDHQTFEEGLSICDLASCRATCCHDGAVLSEEEAVVLGRLDDREGIVRRDDGKWRTRTVDAKENQLAKDFPSHFPGTRCVFLDGEHRCHWQLKAVEEGRHPWFYKPFSCWMHPVLLTRRDGRSCLTILSRQKDRAGFASHTPCGRVNSCAKPARLSLQMELEMLKSVSGRDLAAELNAPPI